MNAPRLIFILSIVLFPIISFSQDHGEHRNEIGLGAGAAKIIHEPGMAPSVHLHVSRSFKEESPFSGGLGFEAVFDEHRHTFFSLGIAYTFRHSLTAGISPGIFIASSDEKAFGLHLELNYGFEIQHIHLGPMIEYGIGPEESHLTFGIHTGIGF